MCLECDGYSHEAAMQALDLQIRVHGWALVQVSGDGDSWSYTIGLAENFGHPELTVLDLKPALQVQVLNHLVSLVVDHGCVPQIDLDEEGITLVEVHDDHLHSSLFANWRNRYGMVPDPGEFLQVVMPDDCYCPFHTAHVRRLDRPGPLEPIPAAPRPNRAARRARARGKEHGH